MLPVYEQVAPLYNIRYFNDDLYRVTKRKRSVSKGAFTTKLPDQVELNEDDEADHARCKAASALSRAKCTVRELALCNEFEYFVTLTFSKEKVDRYQLQPLVKDLMQWIQNYNKSKREKNRRLSLPDHIGLIRYLLVPEFHKDGAVHLHGCMSGIRVGPQLPTAPKDWKQYDRWIDFDNRYGLCSVSPIVSQIGSGFYMSKYITKSLADKSDMLGVHTYYHSRGLGRARLVGSLYRQNTFLDGLLKYENPYYAFSFCKFDSFRDVVSMCDEVDLEEDEDMFQQYVIQDPVTSEVVALIGGDDQDEYIQEVLEAFRSGQYLISAHPDV